MDLPARLTDIHRKIVELIDGGHPLAVALVLAATGSTPQRAGAKAVIDATGYIWGTVGGGAVEAEAQRVAVEACWSQRPVVFDFHMEGGDAAEAGAICGGTMRILVDPTVAKHRACYVAAAEALERRERGALVTTIRTDAEASVQVEWIAEADMAGRGIRADESAGGYLEQVAGRSCEVFIEPITPRPLLLVAGGGHVGQALAVQAVQIGFDVTIVDDRPEFAAPAVFPREATVCCGPLAEQIAAHSIDKDTYVVIVTRGHRQDAEALAACIRRRPAYIGMIGSRRKVALMRQNFLENGLATAEEWNRVHAPVGLSIGAVTVPEIAVSIAAELIAARRKTRTDSENRPEAFR
jgi:xanthine dehydrogenase accessory factor